MATVPRCSALVFGISFAGCVFLEKVYSEMCWLPDSYYNSLEINSVCSTSLAISLLAVAVVAHVKHSLTCLGIDRMFLTTALVPGVQHLLCILIDEQVLMM